MSDRVEKIILESLIGSEEYARIALPFLKDEYFDSRIDKTIFGEISGFFEKHGKLPTKRIIQLALDDNRELKQDEFNEAVAFVKSFDEAESNQDWLIERTEKFCKDKAIYNSIMTAISIMDGRNDKYNQDAIPSLLQDALGICFDKNVGHDFFEKAEDRFEFYHKKEDRIPFDLDMFNKITKGGLPRKTLSCALAGVNVGKSLFLCHHAASVLKQGFNVLYITMEMAEERIAERIDCNLIDVDLDALHGFSKDDYIERINRIENKTNGKLIVKEYPTGGAHVGHFRSLLEELKTKRGFTPDVIYVDYLNICASQKYKAGASYNSYFAVKAIAEELRGLAVEYNVAMVTATQSTRAGVQDGDLEMTDVSESFGTAATMDFMFAIIRTEELDQMGKLMIKQLKSRFNDVGYYRKFVIGIDISKFKLYSVENATDSVSGSGQTDDKPKFDKSKFGAAIKERARSASSIDFT